MGCFLSLRPSGWRVARNPLLPIHVRFDQACINRKSFAADQASRDACRHHALEHTSKGTALPKALPPGTAEHRMVGDAVLDAELAEPAIGKVHLHLGADTSLRSDRKD